MDENHQDKTESKLTATEDNSTPPSLSAQGQRGTDQLHDNQMEDTIKHLRGKPGYKVIVEYDKPGHPSKFSQEIPPRKTGWDLANLIAILLIPLVIAGATLLLSIQQVHLTDLQHQSDQKLAQQQQDADQKRTLDQQEATTLQTYIDNIQDLLLNHNLLKSKSTDEVAILARARTLTALRGLDPQRKGVFLNFLYEANLIGYYDHNSNKLLNPIIDLSGADLSAAVLVGANLVGATLSAAVLSGANLVGANLVGADLSDSTVTQQQLDQVYSCQGATLPAGLTCHKNH